jgi:RNA polymerase sigma factor (sigma-70 family)
MDSHAFQELIRGVRAGDQDAAAELVEQFGPELRRAVRMRLTDPRLRRKYDSLDICQSVLANFFVRIVGGQFVLPAPGHLVRLLVRMAHNKLVDHARKPDHRREAENAGDLGIAAGPDDSPSNIVAQSDLAAAVREQLTEEETRIAELRADGCGWAEIAATLGATADGVRKKMDRAIERLCRRFDFDVSHYA